MGVWGIDLEWGAIPLRGGRYPLCGAIREVACEGPVDLATQCI